MKFAIVTLLVLVSTGCVSAETKRAAAELQAQIEVNRKVSVPRPGIDPAAWEQGQKNAADLSLRVKQGVQ